MTIILLPVRKETMQQVGVHGIIVMISIDINVCNAIIGICLAVVLAEKGD